MPAAMEATSTKIPVTTLLTPDIVTVEAFVFSFDSTSNSSTAVISLPYISSRSIMTPLDHPNPNCTSYSPPPPVPPAIVASY